MFCGSAVGLQCVIVVLPDHNHLLFDLALNKSIILYLTNYDETQKMAYNSQIIIKKLLVKSWWAYTEHGV